MQILETADLILKKGSPDDFDAMIRNFWSDHESAKTMLWKPVDAYDEGLELCRRALERQAVYPAAFWVYEKATGEAIGAAGMKEVSPGVWEDAGIGIGSRFTGCGLGTQILSALIDHCFQALNAEKVVCSCMTENRASARMMEKCGMVRTAAPEEPEVRKWDGYRYHIFIYELTREAWTHMNRA